MEIDYSLLDEETLAFITWYTEILDDPEHFLHLMKEALNEAKNFLAYPPSMLQSLLIDKTILGAIQHGPPPKEEESVKHELRGEYKDMVNWFALLLWIRYLESLPNS